MIYCQAGFARRYKMLAPQQCSRVDAAVARFEEKIGKSDAYPTSPKAPPSASPTSR